MELEGEVHLVVLRGPGHVGRWAARSDSGWCCGRGGHEPALLGGTVVRNGLGWGSLLGGHRG